MSEEKRDTKEKAGARTGLFHKGAENAEAKEKTARDPGARARRRRARKEKTRKGVKYVLVAIGVIAMLLSVSTMACVGVLNQAQSGHDYELTGGVAATVNGVNITEDTITEQIMSTKASYDDDAAWATYLAQSGMTPETYREQLIDSYARQYLLTQAIKEQGCEATDDQIQKEWDDTVSNYDSEDAFIQQLSAYGMDEDSYKQQLSTSIAQENLRDKVAPLEDPGDDEIVQYVNDNLDTYNDARRSSHILIKVDSDADDETRAKAQEKAQEILDKINSGEISFEDAAKKYSEDSSADDGGDVGWDKLTSFVTEYQDALSQLQPGQISGIVESTYGYHIIECTDYFHVDGQVTSVDQIPQDLRDKISDTIASNDQTDAYNKWLDDYVDKADITINPMPDNVPYNVDMSLAESSSDESDAASGEGGASTSEDGSAEAASE